MIEDETSLQPIDAASNRILRQNVIGIIDDCLEPREKKVILLRFGLDGTGIAHTLEEIGEVFHVTRERVRQIEEVALNKIRNHRDSYKLVDFLEGINPRSFSNSGPQKEENTILEIPFNKKVLADKVIDLLAAHILNKTYSLFFLRGEMGSGKTTIVKDVSKKIGSKEEATSPTFALIHKYELKDASQAKKVASFENIAHLDLHRLKTIKVEDKTWIEEELINTHNIVFVEWPEKLLKDEPFMKYLGRPFLVIDCKVGKKEDHYFRIRKEEDLKIK